MAAHCFGITAITSVLSEHLDVVDEIKLYQTCSTVYSGNKVHRDVLQNLREYYWCNKVIPTLQVILTSCHLPTMTAGNPTDQKLVAGGSGGDHFSSKVVTDPAAYLLYNFGNESDPNVDPGYEFIVDLSTKWECMILMTVMTIVCVLSCLDIILGKELLFHPYC